jgi:hypothetical protein
MKTILFAKTSHKPIDKQLATNEILKVDDKFWHWDPYRGIRMLPLMTKNAVIGEAGTFNGREGTFDWVSYTPTVIKDWFEQEIFPWMGAKTRIMALLTPPGIANNEHIDCNLEEVGSRQHKFRVVLQGRTGTLYFKTSEGDVTVPDIEESFIMDGGWPHGMLNDSVELKLTLAAGAPWTGHDSYNNVETLMFREDYILPTELSAYTKK